MRLSNKKLKYIRRHASRESAEQIANHLKIPTKVVVKAIRQVQDPARKKSALHRKTSLEKLCFWVLAGMVFLMPLLVTDYLYDNVGGLKMLFAMLSALVLLIIWLLHGYTTAELKILSCALLLPLVCFLAWSLISITWSLDGYGGFVQWLHWVACALIFFMALQVLADAERIRIVLTLIFFSGFLVSLVGILQYLIAFSWFPQAAPPAATFGNKNMAAHFIVLSLPVGIWLFGTDPKKGKTWISAGASASMVIYLFYTHTKAAWVAVSVQALFLVLYLVFVRFRLKTGLALNPNKLMALGAATAVVLVMVNLGPRGWQWQIGDATREMTVSVLGEQASDAPETALGNRGQSAAVRFTIWLNTFSIFRDRPFTGVGVANFRSHYPASMISGINDGSMRLGMQHYYTHNDYLQLLVELGVVFVILFVWGLFLVFRFMGRLLAPACNAEYRLIGITILGAIVGLATNALFSFPMYSPVPPVMLAIYLAILSRVALATTPEPKRSMPLVPSAAFPEAALTGAMVALALLTIWIAIQVRWVKADRYYKLQSIALLKNNYQKMIHWGEKAHLNNPYRKDVRQYLGQGYLLNHEPSKAKPHLLAYKEAFPHDMKNLYHLGQCYQALNLYPEAHQVLEHLKRILPFEGLVHDSLRYSQ